jgi:hypothetical protein
MADATLDNRALLRKTLVTMGAMVGACVVVVGSLALVALGIAGHAVGSGDSPTGDAGLVVMGARGTTLGAPPPVQPPSLPKKK